MLRARRGIRSRSPEGAGGREWPLRGTWRRNPHFEPGGGAPHLFLVGLADEGGPGSEVLLQLRVRVFLAAVAAAGGAAPGHLERRGGRRVTLGHARQPRLRREEEEGLLALARSLSLLASRGVSDLQPQSDSPSFASKQLKRRAAPPLPATTFCPETPNDHAPYPAGAARMATVGVESR